MRETNKFFYMDGNGIKKIDILDISSEEFNFEVNTGSSHLLLKLLINYKID